tara:strand:- start:72 stop:1040 length:969 start_codon:yes stop_codon:yes gene_type:complete
MSQSTSNTTAFIEATQYSDFILQNLHDGLLPTAFYRNVSDFGSGTTLNIKTIGSATIQEITENEDLTYNPIDTGVVQLSITDYVGDAWYVTDILRQDGAQLEALHAARGQEAMRAIQENFETRFLSTMNLGQTAANPNTINGFSHRFLASGTNETLADADLIDMGLAFDKANVPMSGRVAIVDPITAAAFGKRSQLTSNLDAAGPVAQSLVKDGFMKEHKFVTSIYGWDIFTSNRLPTLASGAAIDGTATAPTEGGVVNIFMCMADDNCKPGMVAWRQPPKVETGRDRSKKRDEFDQTARWGVGVQRTDTLGVIVTNAALSA